MFDMHSHILPSIDDGSDSIEETIRIANTCEKHGIKAIVATPHYIETSHETLRSNVIKGVTILNKILEDKGYDLRVYPGNEVYFTNNIIELITSKTVCTLNNTRYILIELPMNGMPLSFYNSMKNLLNFGYVPILAHPERYIYIEKEIEKIKELISEGMLMQINISSISGKYGINSKKNVVNLLRKNMVHMIGTDAHNSTSVFSVFDESIEKISKIIGSEKLNYILNKVPTIILSDNVL